MEFPRPVPGERTPLTCLELICRLLSEKKSCSGTMSNPYELAMESLRKTNYLILRFFPRRFPSSSFHFCTFDNLTLLSFTGPATPITATYGYFYLGISRRKVLIAYSKLSFYFTLNLPFFTNSRCLS
jgi:hypothetical protein